MKLERKTEKAKLRSVSLKLPFDLGEAEWIPEARERDAAWELYVDLVTRIAVQELKADQGLFRDALSSVYNLFGVTREILRPTVAAECSTRYSTASAG